MQRIFSRKMPICIFTGFTSGLPLYFLINLIPAWLRSEHVDLKTIGLMALIGLPFTWKFIWSPVIDLVRLPFLGRRRGWMLVTQIGPLLTLAAYAFLNPHQHLPIIVGLSVPQVRERFEALLAAPSSDATGAAGGSAPSSTPAVPAPTSPACAPAAAVPSPSSPTAATSTPVARTTASPTTPTNVHACVPPATGSSP